MLYCTSISIDIKKDYQKEKVTSYNRSLFLVYFFHSSIEYTIFELAIFFRTQGAL